MIKQAKELKVDEFKTDLIEWMNDLYYKYNRRKVILKIIKIL